VVWNVYNGGVYDPKLKKYRKNPTHKHGVFDICGFRKSDGRHVEVEIKIGKDQPSDFQTKHFHELREAGAIALIARDFDMFESWFTKTKHEQPKTNRPATNKRSTEFGSWIA
jgi:hypothetical protein